MWGPSLQSSIYLDMETPAFNLWRNQVTLTNLPGPTGKLGTGCRDKGSNHLDPALGVVPLTTSMSATYRDLRVNSDSHLGLDQELSLQDLRVDLEPVRVESGRVG